ncbi:hypothetical protein BJX68DRAFT_260329 [Aspergillus pseudodeflectus]|uniref:Uncharacterized protein n=1 Tax=Aspergillus pseudodeflectus TaxID=176178 RepID=A0ABR4LAM3_9EURO
MSNASEPRQSELDDEILALIQQVEEIELYRGNQEGVGRLDNPPDNELAVSVFLDEVNSALGLTSSRKPAQKATYAPRLNFGQVRMEPGGGPDKAGEYVLATKEPSAHDSDGTERKGKAEPSMTYTGRWEDNRERDGPRFIGTAEKKSRRQQYHEVERHPIEAIYYQRGQLSQHQFEPSPPIVSDEASRRLAGKIPSQGQLRPHQFDPTPARPIHEGLGQWDDPVQLQEQFRTHHLEPTRPRHIGEAFGRPGGTIPPQGQLMPQDFGLTPARRTGFEQMLGPIQLPAGAKPSSATTAVENGELVNVRGNKHYFGIFDSERTWDEL